MLIATSDIYILSAMSFESGLYQMRLQKPIWDREYQIFRGCYAFRALFDAPDDKEYPFVSLSPGASKFQAISLAFEGIRRKFEKVFDSTDTFRFASCEIELDRENLLKHLLTSGHDGEYITRPIRKIRNKIAHEKFNPCRGAESLHVELVLGQPYGAEGKWWCPFQIHPNEFRAIAGEDSFRAIWKAYSFMADWFCTHLDQSWGMRCFEHGKITEYEFAEMKEILFRGCMPDEPSILVERALARKGLTREQFEESMNSKELGN